MVHGLYHNRTAWLLMKQKLNSANYSNTTTWQYNSFTTSYPELILKLRKEIIRLHNENNCKIILVGHSLGGLVISGASNNPEIEKMVSGLITIGTPFRGSVLALIATGHLGRSLHPSSSLFKGNNKILYPTKISKTAIISPTDEMVIPWQNLEPDTQDWKIIRSPALGHVAMLYSRKVAAIVAERISKIQSTNDS
nr:hypothetical protein [Maridesulfovibrio zosterae]